MLITFCLESSKKIEKNWGLIKEEKNGFINGVEFSNSFWEI